MSEHRNTRNEPDATQPDPIHVGVLQRLIAEERIARRAYEIYESRGRQDGHADEDWRQSCAEFAAGAITGP